MNIISLTGASNPRSNLNPKAAYLKKREEEKAMNRFFYAPDA